MGGIRGFFGLKPISNNNTYNPPRRPPSSGGGGGALASASDSNGKSSLKVVDFGKGASPGRTMRKG